MSETLSIESLLVAKSELDKKIADLKFKNRVDDLAKTLIHCSEEQLSLIESIVSSKKSRTKVPLVAIQQDLFSISMVYKNGTVFRSWNRSAFDKDEQRSLELFALLFNNGFHSYEILDMVGKTNSGYVNVIKTYTFSQIKKMVLANIDITSSALIQQINMI